MIESNKKSKMKKRTHFQLSLQSCQNHTSIALLSAITSKGPFDIARAHDFSLKRIFQEKWLQCVVAKNEFWFFSPENFENFNFVEKIASCFHCNPSGSFTLKNRVFTLKITFPQKFFIFLEISLIHSKRATADSLHTATNSEKSKRRWMKKWSEWWLAVESKRWHCSKISLKCLIQASNFFSFRETRLHFFKNHQFSKLNAWLFWKFSRSKIFSNCTHEWKKKYNFEKTFALFIDFNFLMKPDNPFRNAPTSARHIHFSPFSHACSLLLVFFSTTVGKNSSWKKCFWVHWLGFWDIQQLLAGSLGRVCLYPTLTKFLDPKLKKNLLFQLKKTTSFFSYKHSNWTPKKIRFFSSQKFEKQQNFQILGDSMRDFSKTKKC